MNEIVAALDFSPITALVVRQASVLAAAFSAELTLLHVAAPDPDFVGFETGPQTVRDGRAKELRAERRELERMAEELRERDLRVRVLMVQGPTVEKILSEAKRLGADALVLGSHGHGAAYRALLGSVSEGVVRSAACPVLVVPASSGAAV